MTSKTGKPGVAWAVALAICCWCAAAGSLEAKVWPDKLRVKPGETLRAMR